MNTEHESNMISRREILKRGAFVGGAVLWVTPVVQAVGMGRAYAKATSPGCFRYCIKWDVPNLDVDPGLGTCPASSGYTVWGDGKDGQVWDALGQGDHALTCPINGSNNTTAGAHSITQRLGREFKVYGNQAAGFWVTFPADVKLADLTDVGQSSVGAKCGNLGGVTFSPTVEDDPYPCYTDPNGDSFKRIHIPANCDASINRRAISHIEMIVDLCETPQ